MWLDGVGDHVPFVAVRVLSTPRVPVIVGEVRRTKGIASAWLAMRTTAWLADVERVVTVILPS